MFYGSEVTTSLSAPVDTCFAKFSCALFGRFDKGVEKSPSGGFKGVSVIVFDAQLKTIIIICGLKGHVIQSRLGLQVHSPSREAVVLFADSRKPVENVV